MQQTPFKKLQSFPWPKCLSKSSKLKFHVFRDDVQMNHHHGSDIQLQDLNTFMSGNKFRKLQFLLSDHNNQAESLKYENVFKNYQNLKEIHSYGSIQSNAMLSIAYLCFRLGISFKYFIERDLKYIESNSQFGNLFQVMNLKSQGLQMEFVPLTERQEYENLKQEFFSRTIVQRKSFNETNGILYIREGVSQYEAQIGYSQMALELNEMIQKELLLKEDMSERFSSQHYRFNVFLPSGTGTSALFLSKFLNQLNKSCNHYHFRVFTTNCVGSDQYLRQQFYELEPFDSSIHPTILETTKYFRYGQLYKEMYAMIQNLKHEIGIQFEYLYDAKGFLALQEQYEKLLQSQATNISIDDHLIYIHSGGLIGNASMEDRYKRFLTEKV
ncbi:hypothetical protein C9374_007936 [Naegleria lovaniensis]|uniref:1-aminocyclopropane-1-carboxylate deaminase n=1 Tax=Naegleria lovaniensis TaxID=51637 RepID=A0AA88GM71_NAELO|nr:uncharacterized protein C9374_007936 [Naegleria lovaniensis]KAG2378788.1 hypothetical protein C9374_007936 [Naegleria lovaniensis]